MKRTVTLLALLAALCCLLTVSAAAADAPTSGTCGENLTWALDGAGTLRIAGEGAMEEYGRASRVPWYQSSGSIKAVVIENSVTTIGNYAFYGCSSLTSITIPESVTSIGANAFAWCYSLASITIPESVTNIGESAFDGCSSLTSIAIPKSVISIGSHAFSECTSLTDVSIADMDAWCRIDFGWEDATPMCYAKNIRLNGSKIASVTVPEGVTELSYTFYGFKDLIKVKLPESLTSVGNSAFEDCSSLASVNIPDSVTSIGSSAFHNCNSLASVNIPEGVPEIFSHTFDGCGNLTGITIPASVTFIGYRAFINCTGLTSVVFAEASQLGSIGDSAFWGCRRLAHIIIPEGVVSIGEYAFYSCETMESITIPASVKTISDHAFFCSYRLKTVYITDLKAWLEIDFENDSSVTGEVYSNPLNYAQNLYLNGELVESLEIPEETQVIRQGLFRNATCLKRVAIPRSLAGVAANAFEKCTNITEVFYEGSESEWANLPISAGNDPLKNAQVYFGSTLDDYYCRISVQVSGGGRVTVDHTAARAGETVTVTATPYQGYALAAVCVDGTEIEGNTFAVTGNHVVSAVFTRVPVVGGTEDFRLEGLSVRTAAGETLQELPAESLLVTVAVKHLNETGSGTILLAQYDSQGRYRGLMWLTLEEMPQGMTLRVTLPVDNSSGEIANLKVFVVEDLTSPLPVGTPVSFGQV